MSSAALLITASLLVWALEGQAGPENGAEAPPVESAPATPPGGSIVAIVGNDPIPRSELDRAVTQRMLEIREEARGALTLPNRLEVARWVLDDLIRQKLLLHEARRLVPADRRLEEIIPEDLVFSEVERRIEFLKKQGSTEILSREDYFNKQQQLFGLSRKQVIGKFREEILISQYLWEQVFGDAKLDRFISPQELRHYYLNHRDEFTEPLRYSYRTIRFREDYSAFEKIRLVREALAAGEPFVDVAKKYSQEFTKNPELQGYLWEKSLEDIEAAPAPLPQILRRLKESEVSEPFRLQGEIVFVRLEKVEVGEPMAFEEAQPRIEVKLLAERRASRVDALLRRLREKIRIETYLEPPALDPRAGEAVSVSGGGAP